MLTLMIKIQAAALIASNTYGVDKELILDIIQVESQFEQYAVGSSHGEIGLMQVRPEFHSCASFDVFENIMCGTAYLAKIKEIKGRKFPNSWWVYYNVGPYSSVTNPSEVPYFKKVRDGRKVLEARR